jgi:hypothetical protein
MSRASVSLSACTTSPTSMSRRMRTSTTTAINMITALTRKPIRLQPMVRSQKFAATRPALSTACHRLDGLGCIVQFRYTE